MAPGAVMDDGGEHHQRPADHRGRTGHQDGTGVKPQRPQRHEHEQQRQRGAFEHARRRMMIDELEAPDQRHENDDVDGVEDAERQLVEFARPVSRKRSAELAMSRPSSSTTQGLPNALPWPI